MSEDKTKDFKHFCDSTTWGEVIGTDYAEKNNELESNNRQVKKILEHCSLFRELMELEVSVASIKEKLGQMILDESIGSCRVEGKTTKEVLHFMKEIDFVKNEVYYE